MSPVTCIPRLKVQPEQRFLLFHGRKKLKFSKSQYCTSFSVCNHLGSISIPHFSSQSLSFFCKTLSNCLLDILKSSNRQSSFAIGEMVPRRIISVIGSDRFLSESNQTPFGLHTFFYKTNQILSEFQSEIVFPFLVLCKQVRISR